MKTMTPWILLAALSLTGLTNCSDDSDDDDGNGGTSGSSAGKGGSSAGKGGSAGTAGKGGSAGTAGKGGSAGTAGKGGSAGSAGAEEGGAAGEGGAAAGAGGTDAGAAGEGGSPAAGTGGVDGGGAPATAGAGGAGGEGGAAALTDARILHVVITVNTGEVSLAQLAIMRATAATVASFADEMATEHGTAIQRANSIATEQTITPEDNPLSQMLAAESADTLAELNAVAAAEFDVAYMESQVAMHEEVLTLIETQLLPEADNAAIVDFLGDIQAEVEAHLLDAEVTLDAL